MRLVVTGTPGSGTRYVAKLLTAAGVDTGHESALHHGGAGGEFRLQQCRHQAEVSWYAAPWLRLFVMPTVHLVRHPLDTVGTLMRMAGWFDRTVQKDTIERFAPGMYDLPDGPVRYARFWLDWNRLAEQADYRWPVAAITVEDIRTVAKQVQLATDPTVVGHALASTSKSTGSRNRHGKRLAWEDLGPLAEETRERAVGYGLEDR